MLPGWNDFESLREYFGDTTLLEEIARTMRDNELLDICEFIARVHDVPMMETD